MEFLELAALLDALDKLSQDQYIHSVRMCGDGTYELKGISKDGSRENMVIFGTGEEELRSSFDHFEGVYSGKKRWEDGV